MKNKKRGAMEIVLLVVLVLLVASVSLFTFGAGASYTKVNINDAKFVESFYQKQDLAEFYIRQVGEEAKNSEKDFGVVFKEGFSKYKFEEDYLKELQKIISEDKFSFFSEEDIVGVMISSWEIKDSSGKIQIKYVPKISVAFNLEN